MTRTGYLIHGTQLYSRRIWVISHTDGEHLAGLWCFHAFGRCAEAVGRDTLLERKGYKNSQRRAQLLFGDGDVITIQDLYNIVGNKIANETGKAIIRNNFPPQIAEQMCRAIDGHERAEHFQRLLREYSEWMQSQQRQQEMVERFLREYYK